MSNILEHKKNYSIARNAEMKGTKKLQKRKLEEEEQLLIIKAFNEEWDKKNKDEEE